MKKILAVFVTIIFATSLSLALAGCKKAEEKAQTTKVAAPIQKAAPATNVSPASPASAVPAVKDQQAPEAASSAKKPKRQLKSCYDEAKAKDLRGEERSRFMTDCIRSIK